ncbi:predicted protein [Histoplasma mississippiense (nom. inval.)]|uniref:predicted protein n=1 Tax=Ajellomyces capsulatus (strain NAm1 / WU24) TaxID=2059318 RepID=UPI000157B414|nr:predicted protein [Histoplasma mississippiense (nom. inval.)]EDN02759.1 predicted protein [Histoplasma mississippiense (nom. inval.)]
MAKPTVVFVPGGFHTPAIFDPVLPFLHAAGYPTASVYLPSVGVSPGIPDLSPDVEAVNLVVGGLVALGREVLLVAHSYGGVPSSEGLQGLSKQERQAQGLAGGVDPTALLPENPIEAFYHDLDPAVAKYYASLLRRQSVGPFLSQITHESYRQIPTSCLLLSNDRAVSLARQKRVAKNAGIQQLLGPINCGHSPFLSHPEEVSKFIRQVAGET